MKLKTNTSLTIIIVAAIVLQMISAVQYYYTRSLLADELEKRAESELTMKAIVVKNSLNMSENSLMGHIRDLKRNIAYPDSMYSVMEWVLRSHPNLTGCWVAFVPNYFPEKGRLFEPFAWWDNGEIKYSEIAAAGRDYTQNKYYKAAHAANVPMWTDAYEEIISGVRMTTYLVPVHDSKKNIVALFGLDVATGLLGDTLNYRHVYPSSYDILLTEKGELLAAPDSNKVKPSNVENIVRIINDSTVTKTRSQSGRSFVATFYDDDGEKAYVYYASFKGSPPWQIAVVCYDKEAFGKLRKMRLHMGLLMLLGIVVLGLIISRFAKSNRNLQKAMVEQERIGSELRIAKEIQREMLPETFPPYPDRDDIDIYGLLLPAREVGGDLFDFFLRDEKLYFCIGDVSGKGVPSAMLMAVTHSLFRAVSAHNNNPAYIMQTINETLCEGNESNMFVTMFIGILDLPTGRLCYCNAGHDAPVVVGGEALPVKANMPLGLFDDFTYQMQETVLEGGSMLFLYTDGVTEAMNGQRKQFGLSRVNAVLQGSADLTPQQLLEKMTQQVHAFVEDAPQSDDLTMLAIRYSPVVHDLLFDEELTLQNDVLQVKDLNAFVKQAMSRLGIEQSLAREIQLAVEEAVVNVMEYAYPEDEIGDITVRISSDEQWLKFIIKDSGAAFDPTLKDTSDIPMTAKERPEGGLGIFLVREMMESINYTRTDGMNVLTLLKKIK